MQTDCDTLRFLQSLSSCQVRQGYWIGQPSPNCDGNVETSLLWSTRSDTCICHDSHDARRCFDEGSGPFSFVACGNERTSPRVRDLRIQYKCEDNIADVFRAHANSQNGDWLSADSISRTFWIRASLMPCSVSLILWTTLNFGIFVPSTSVFNIITVGHIKRGEQAMLTGRRRNKFDTTHINKRRRKHRVESGNPSDTVSFRKRAMTDDMVKSFAHHSFLIPRFRAQRMVL